MRATECWTRLCLIYTLQEHYGSVPNYFNPLIHQGYLEVIDLFCRTPLRCYTLRMCPDQLHFGNVTDASQVLFFARDKVAVWQQYDSFIHSMEALCRIAKYLEELRHEI